MLQTTTTTTTTSNAAIRDWNGARRTAFPGSFAARAEPSVQIMTLLGWHANKRPGKRYTLRRRLGRFWLARMHTVR